MVFIIRLLVLRPLLPVFYINIFSIDPIYEQLELLTIEKPVEMLRLYDGIEFLFDYF